MTELQTELVKVSENGGEPVSVDDAKSWLRVDSTDDDFLIGALCTAARQHAEIFCATTFKSGDVYRFTLNRFPFPQLMTGLYLNVPVTDMLTMTEAEYLYNRPNEFAITLPNGPVMSVSSITYIDPQGVTQTVNPANYELVNGDFVDTRIFPTSGNYWPGVRYGPASVQINYTTGGTTPELVQVAIKQMVAHWYANREAVSTDGKIPQVMPMSAKNLLYFYQRLDHI